MVGTFAGATRIATQARSLTSWKVKKAKLAHAKPLRRKEIRKSKFLVFLCVLAALREHFSNVVNLRYSEILHAEEPFGVHPDFLHLEPCLLRKNCEMFGTVFVRILRANALSFVDDELDLADAHDLLLL